jgi:hypothetical protein
MFEVLVTLKTLPKHILTLLCVILYNLDSNINL